MLLLCSLMKISGKSFSRNENWGFGKIYHEVSDLGTVSWYNKYERHSLQYLDMCLSLNSALAHSFHNAEQPSRSQVQLTPVMGVE